MAVMHRMFGLSFALLVAACGSAETEAETAAKANAFAELDEPTNWDAEGTELDGPNDLSGKVYARRVEAHTGGPAGPATATYPGFRMFADGSSRVFLEVRGSVDVQEAKDDGVMKFRFRGVKVPERVNRLPLPTNHFETPVSRVHVEQDGDDALLIIALHYDVKGRPRMKRSEDGTVLSVDFPPYKLSEHHDRRLGRTGKK